MIYSPTLRRAWPRDGPEAAICVQGVDVQCVLQFTLIHAASCALHRRTSQVIHRSKLFSTFFAFSTTDVSRQPATEVGGGEKRETKKSLRKKRGKISPRTVVGRQPQSRLLFEPRGLAPPQSEEVGARDELSLRLESRETSPGTRTDRQSNLGPKRRGSRLLKRRLESEETPERPQFKPRDPTLGPEPARSKATAAVSDRWRPTRHQRQPQP